jgi:NADH:ubiquinone oxidoreductase subunit C
MEKEAIVLERMKERFPGLDTAQATFTTRRIHLSVPEDIFMDVLAYADKDLGFDHLLTITGLDTGECYEFIYHVSNLEGILLNLKRKAKREDPVVISSVLPIYQGATFYERELEGMLGVKVDGLPEGRQYPLPDNWPKDQYPLRKDWTPPKKGDQE